jgi:hypothetical protein
MCCIWEVTAYDSILKDAALRFGIYPLIIHDLCDPTPIMEAVVFVEKSVHIYRDTRCYIPKDGLLLIHQSEKLVSHNVIKLGHIVNRKLFLGLVCRELL